MPDANMEEIKGLLDAQGKAFEEFKQSNDQKLEQLSKKGSADVITVEKVQKIDDALNDLAEKSQAANLKLTAIEKLAARPNADGKGAVDPEEKKKDAEFFHMLRKGTGEHGKNAAIQFEAVETKADGEVIVDSQGGYYVRPTFANRIVERVFETTPMRAAATIMTTGGDDIEFLANTADIDANWVGETATRAKTKSPAPQKIRIPVNEAYASPQLTQKLLDDAYFDLEAYLTGKIGDRLARLENAAFINGTGVGQPRGFTTYANVNTDDGTRAWGQMQYTPIGFTSVASWIGGTNPGDVLVTALYKLKTELLGGAQWMMARECLTGVRQLKNSVGGYLWQPSYQAGQPSMLLDYPVTIAPDMPAVASNSYSIAVGNFAEGYTIVDRMGVRLLRDPFTNKPFIVFYATKRTGGDVVNFEAIKLLKFAAS